MARRGIETIFYYQVDNPLVRMADPAFLGFHAEAGAEMSCKVVRKVDPAEKVGVLARVNGRAGVVEYTEIEDEHRQARDADGQLVYWAGNMAIHAFETAFVRRIADRADELLPFHASAKKIPTVDERGEPLRPEVPNGHKLERFVFDALSATDRVCVVETRREQEYSPVKNAEGSDSPASARRDLVRCYRAWLEAADIELPSEAVYIEIDHSVIDGPEDARSLGIRRIEDRPDVIRTGAGAE
jgi:UDP-N-acetylglucosamine/UDP-N-acetylgalactosamine diphosphorylase